MNLNSKPSLDYPNKIALSILIFLIVFSGLIFFLVMPAAEKTQQIKVNVESQSLEVEKNYLAGKNLRNLAADIKTVEPGLNELEQLFIKKNEAMDFIAALEKIADKNKVLEKVSLGAETKLTNSYSKIPAQLEIRGDFAGTTGYLADLESLNYYLNVTALEISSVSPAQSTATGSKSSLIMQISADTYWQN